MLALLQRNSVKNRRGNEKNKKGERGEKMKSRQQKTRFAVQLARACPIHLGHEYLIREMIGEFGIENSLMILGSRNAPITLRNFFSYTEKKRFVKTIFPPLRVVGLPDFPDSMEKWFAALDALIERAFGKNADVTFFGGCEEDVVFFIENGRKVKLINRFDGTTPKISATEVRDCLVSGRSLDGLVNPLIEKEVRSIFAAKWEKFKKI